MGRIQDGSGNNRYARVNINKRLETSATTQSEEHAISSAEGLAFFANTANTANFLTVTATGGDLLYLRNDHATKQLVIEKVLVSSDTAGIYVIWKRNPTLGTIGNNNVHAPTILNFGTTVDAQGTFYNWDEVGDGMTGITGGTIVNTFIVNTGFTAFPIDAAMILEPGNSLVISTIGAAELSCGVRMFYMDKESQ